MPLCLRLFYLCLVVTCWERADLLALVRGALLCVCHFPIGILGQVWYLIVSIPDLCTLNYFQSNLESYDKYNLTFVPFCIIEFIKRVAKKQYNSRQASHFISFQQLF